MPPKFKTPSRGKLSKISFRQHRKDESLKSSEDESLTHQFKQLYVRESSKRINPVKTYISELQRTKRFFALSRHSYFAVADCNETGKLTKKYCILEKHIFTDGVNHECLFTCSCGESSARRKRLETMCKQVKHERLSDFIIKEKASVCIHLHHVDSIFSNNIESLDTCEFTDDVVVDQLSASPLLVAVYVEDLGYGIVQLETNAASKQKLVCVSCKSNIHMCEHVKSYKNWGKKQLIDIDSEIEFHRELSPDEEFKSISSQRISYPLPENLREKFDEYESQKRDFPIHFVPEISTDTCIHGSAWDERNPIQMGWIASTSVKIHKAHITINADDGESRFVYFRPTVGDCRCKLEYDGQEDLVFNLDNNNFIFYGVLFQYLFSMIHTGSPLISMHRHFSATNTVMSNAEVIPFSVLRKAWNAFARMLDLDYSNVFVCKICGTNPSDIICDGTDVGMKKDLLPEIVHDRHSVNSSSKPIKGSKHSDRTYMKSAPCRRLLLMLAGEKPGNRRKRTKALDTIPLSRMEIKTLKDLLKKEGKTHLVEIVDELIKSKEVPYHFAVILAELGRNTPVCGIIQIGGNKRCLDILTDISLTGKNVFDSVNGEKLSILQQQVPVISEFLGGFSEKIPQHSRQLLLELLSMYQSIFDIPITPESSYSDPIESPCDVFPSLPKVRGRGLYEADRKTNNNREDFCRKESWGHPTLSPGIFTVYCPHGICYGFSILENHESPRHPFEILKARFQTAPSVIVYDNACKLHQYALLREPHFFKDTLFVVDKFHWKGHIACSMGYNISMYGTHDILNKLNSQVNEQGNAGVQKLKGHLSYMTFSNFKFHLKLYYAVRNLDLANDKM